MKNMLAWRRDVETGELTEKPRIYYFPRCVDFERQMLNAVYAGTEDDPKGTYQSYAYCFGYINAMIQSVYGGA